MKDKWVRKHLADGRSAWPFSFTYDGQPSAKLLAKWPVKVGTEPLDEYRTRRTLTWTDRKTGLEVRCVAVDYADYPVIEWTVFLKNTGSANTPVLEDVQALDVRFERASQKMFVDRYVEEDVQLDYWWMDAGWYPCKGHWTNTGTWEVDKTRFPTGLRAVTDHARTKGVKTILWFEPERVGDKESWLAKNHPEWLLQGRLLNLGHPEARHWVTDRVDSLINSEAVDFYRQDFNMDPLGCWAKNDTPDRIGATENFYVQGYLAYWDELRRRHPGLPIDSCASGGRRNDLETMRRAVPLIRSDHLFEPTSQQCHHYAYASWIPYHGAAYPGWGQNHKIDAYEFRSNMSASMTLCFDMRVKELDYDLLRRLDAEARRINGYYTADFHPLTPYDLRDDAWMAWQYHRPDSGDGMIQAFRRPKNDQNTKTFRLGGLDAKAKYEVADLTRGRSQVVTGTRLMKEGLTVKIADQPGAVIIVYRPVQQRRTQ